MKSLIIILSIGFIEMPFENKLSCVEQGSMWLDMNAIYKAQGSRPADQGLYTKQGKLVYGFMCV